jgi:hypothetical protein
MIYTGTALKRFDYEITEKSMVQKIDKCENE